MIILGADAISDARWDPLASVDELNGSFLAAWATRDKSKLVSERIEV